ncbi:MAG: hypothetical protein V5A58_01515 [Salinibacter sp.]|uniref:hypothetical protein n=1 Tax=Salinibacter sp. TaxID=2065818 RepID=UPI002FC2B793
MICRLHVAIRGGCAGLFVLLLAFGAECRPEAASGDRASGPARGSTAVAPIVDVGEGQLFGASRGDEWVSAGRAVDYVEAGQSYRLIQGNDTLGTRAGSASEPPRETCDNPAVQIRPRPASPRDVIAVAGSWPLLPRAPQVQDTTQAVYKTAVAQHLRGQGIEIEAAAVSLDQVLRVDLDGDETMEVLVVSHRARGSATSAQAGDYGLVLLRTVVDGAVRQRAVEAEYYREACLGECAPSTYRVAAVLDANGDETMEVVTAMSYFEGRGKRIYAIDDGEPGRVLSWRCGV